MRPFWLISPCTPSVILKGGVLRLLPAALREIPRSRIRHGRVSSPQALLLPLCFCFAMLSDFASGANFQVDSVPSIDLAHTCVNVDHPETAAMLDAALPRRRVAEYLRDIVGMF